MAHNSFVHAFTELGFFGGALFLGAFTAALVMLYRLRNDCHSECECWRESTRELKRMLPYVTAMLVGFAVSMFSLSRNYFVPTYLVLGLATAYVQIATGQTEPLPLQFDSGFSSGWPSAASAFWPSSTSLSASPPAGHKTAAPK